MTVCASAQSITGVKVATDNINAGIVNGVVAMDIGKKYNGALAINNAAGVYPWKVTGSGFGTTKGTAKLGDKLVPISGWSDTSITLDLTTKDLNSADPYGFKSDYTQTLTLTTSKGKAATKSVWWVPAVESRVFGQCTWWVAANRKPLGLSVPNYSSYTALSKTWVPATYQGLKWGTSSHNALVEYGIPQKDAKGNPNGYYLISITEYNGKVSNGFYRYTTTIKPSAGEYPGESWSATTKATGFAN